jgi:predicted metal-dependent hydrolase
VNGANADLSALKKLFEGGELPANYRCFFACFNRQQFYEAHEILEELWLAGRGRADADFFKGLIQLAGAFVHLQKSRMRPAAALFRLARANLGKFPARCHGLDTRQVRRLMDQWLGELEAGGFAVNPLPLNPAPRLNLEDGSPPPFGDSNVKNAC